MTVYDSVLEMIWLRNGKIFAEVLFMEIIFFKFFGGRIDITGCCYRPPDTDLGGFNDMLGSTLDILNMERKLCFLWEDFNLDLLKSKTQVQSESEFLNISASSFFYPLIHKPTRVTKSSATLATFF